VTEQHPVLQRLDVLKSEIASLSRESESFSKVAAALKNPLEWRLGNEAVVGYGTSTAQIFEPDVSALGQRVLKVQKEHNDLVINGSRQLEGSLREFFISELNQLDSRRS